MALITSGTCKKCGKGFTTAVGSGQPRPTTCTECELIEKDKARRQHFSGLDGLTIEEPRF
jgi:hypothetical protein